MTTEATPTTTTPTTAVSFSSLAKFLYCPRAYELRYEYELSRISTTDAIYFGSAFHDAVELYYRAVREGWFLEDVGDDYVRKVAKKSVELSIQDSDPDWRQDPAKVERFNNITVTVGDYLARWGKTDTQHELSDEKLEIVAIEQPFDLPLVNPDTRRRSRTFRLVGKLDGVVRLKTNRRLYVHERKTTAVLESYLERMFTDFQTRLYFDAVEQMYGERPAGVIYDITERCGLRQRRRRVETAQEFDERIERMYLKFQDEVEKLKTKDGQIKGKIARDAKLRSAQEVGPKTWEAESDESYRERVQLWRAQQPVGCYRSIATFTDDDIEEVQRTAWQVAGMIRDARRTKVWPQNWTACFSRYTCSYVEVCRSGGLDELNAQFYEVKPAHSETVEDVGALRDLAERAAVALDAGECGGGGAPF